VLVGFKNNNNNNNNNKYIDKSVPSDDANPKINI